MENSKKMIKIGGRDIDLTSLDQDSKEMVSKTIMAITLVKQKSLELEMLQSSLSVLQKQLDEKLK